MFKFSIVAVFFSILSIINTQAAGVKGYIKTDTGELLPFATIYVQETSSGAIANADAFYEIKLKPGVYNLRFQYLGYESVNKRVEIKDEYINLDVVLKSQTVVLEEVKVKAGKEDPAYTIMRKAIAKAKYHTQQIDSFYAKVYIKGTGRLKDYPFFARGALKKEGIDSTRVFITESISEIRYKRPNTVDEKVISIRSTGDDNNTSPNAYITGSFYNPEVGGAISPLSPKAFSYYRFEYLGSFTERGYTINKISVRPRSRGDDVFNGLLFIVEDYWSIHSLDLSTVKLGIKFKVSQIYEPVEQQAWMPVSHKYEVTGSFFGFEFVYNYLATINEYSLQMNPDLEVSFEVVDEKVDKALAKEIEASIDSKTGDIQEKLSSGKEVTRKELRKVLREYEKEEQRSEKEPEVISNRSFKVDSLAFKKDSTFWADIRPVPLSKAEIKGYQTTDSIAAEEKRIAEGDTLKSKKSGFQVFDFLVGENYKLNETDFLIFRGPLRSLYFNTVEGYNFNTSLYFRRRYSAKKQLQFGPTLRYAFSRKKLIGKFESRYSFGQRHKRSNISLEAGRFVSQFNASNPIHPLVNTFTTLFLERNYLKIYEKDYIRLSGRYRLTNNLTLNLSAEWAERRALSNNSDFSIFDSEGREFTSNVPLNLELADTQFEENVALKVNAGIEARPWQKFRIRNGRKTPISSSSPTFKINYEKGLSNALSSDVDYDLVEVGIDHRFRLGVRGNVQLSVQAGLFADSPTLFFTDFKHFMGNRNPFLTTDPIGSFRLLDYYTYSTADRYFKSHVHYQFRKLLLTRIPVIRLLGLRENVLVNYLATPTSLNYTELGYSIDYIFRIFRIEAVASFQEGQYQDFGVRVGIATNLDNLFN
ncbi:MAG: DUF5686 and carboxypeptidase regulatory-like domain-containing protein [Bacteroidota bacterium]